MTVRLLHGDCREVLATLDPGSIDAVVCDPPYGLKFMGKGWDHGVPGAEFWTEVLRVLKPGGHLLAFGGTRTFHRLGVAVEDAGFEVRDCLSWMYGQGFPKSHDVSKAIDKASGVERQDVYEGTPYDGDVAGYGKGLGVNVVERRPVTPEAERWRGWGTALKPAWEPIVLARKPLAGTVAANVLAHGTGALNVDDTRVATTDSWTPSGKLSEDGVTWGGELNRSVSSTHSEGRWPANVLLTHHENCVETDCHPDCPVRLLDEQTGELHSGGHPAQRRADKFRHTYGDFTGAEQERLTPRGAEKGTPSRFFYNAKVAKKERDLGLPEGEKNDHPTCKPIAVMAWLCRLVTPPGGTVLDPFMGSGSTGVAAVGEGFDFVGVDQDEHYCEIARHRVGHALDAEVWVEGQLVCACSFCVHAVDCACAPCVEVRAHYPDLREQHAAAVRS